MRRAGPLLGVVVLGLVLAPSCGDPAGPNGKFCDVVKRVRATFDPMSKPELYTDPAVLRSGMNLRVAAFTDLVVVAPPAIVGDAVIVRDRLTSISNALKERGDRSSAANDPEVVKLTSDKTFADAQANVARFSTGACKEPVTSSSQPRP